LFAAFCDRAWSTRIMRMVRAEILKSARGSATRQAVTDRAIAERSRDERRRLQRLSRTAPAQIGSCKLVLRAQPARRAPQAISSGALSRRADLQLSEYVLCEMIFDFTMARNRLAVTCFWVLKPIVPPAVPDQHASCFFQLADQVNTLHPTASSATLR